MLMMGRGINNGDPEKEDDQSGEYRIQPQSERDEQQQTDRILSQELLRLSFKERNNINEEIHGVRNAFPEEKEDPECIELSLIAMDCEVGNILMRSDTNNTHGNNHSNEFPGLELQHIPTNRALKLTFLRCELHDPQKAALRLLNYVSLIRDMCSCKSRDCFGEGGRIIASKWFTNYEYSVLKKGVIQLLPFRDMCGRRVMVPFAACFKINSITRIKIILYLLSGASEDVESQKNGLVMLIWPGICEHLTKLAEGFSLENFVVSKQYSYRLQMSLPLRIVAFHFGYEPSPLLRLGRAMILTIMKKTIRIRINILTGSRTELNYKIMSYGIHPSLIPISDKGIIKNRNHIQWIEARERIENGTYGSLAEDTGVECPGIHDVLFNRGKSCQYHPGNVAFRGMLGSNKHRHLNANQTMKKQIAFEIMEEVQQKGGRFMYWDKAGWWVMLESQSEIRHKVATSLRDFNKRIRAIQNQKNTHSSTSQFRHQQGKKRKRDNTDSSSTTSSTDLSDCSCNL